MVGLNMMEVLWIDARHPHWTKYVWFDRGGQVRMLGKMTDEGGRVGGRVGGPAGVCVSVLLFRGRRPPWSRRHIGSSTCVAQSLLDAVSLDHDRFVDITF